jgi:tetratricopeptide (TPR) repeat protein
VKRYILILLVILFQTAGYSAEKNGNAKDELFFKANQLYKDSKFEEALNTYLEIPSGKRGGNIYYNMGNACYRLNMTGQAILYYERAKYLIPRDADLDFNLRYVRKSVKDAVDPEVSVVSGILFWIGSMTRGELFALFAVINLLLSTSLCIRVFIKKEWTFYLPVALLVIWIIIGASFAWKYYSISSDKRVVVLPEEIDVLSGPDAGDTLLFRLHSGTIAVRERTEDNWKLIRLPDGKRGWVKSDAVESIKE